jgi:hypothetical protein
MAIAVIGAWVVGVLGAALSVLVWVNVRQLPHRAVTAGALALGFAGCALALVIPFLSLGTVADTPDQKGVAISCGSLTAPRTDFTAYQYTGEDSSDPKLQGTPAGSGQEAGPGGDPQHNCQSTLSDARLGAIGGGLLGAIALAVTIAYGYRKPGGTAPVESGSEAPDAEITI